VRLFVAETPGNWTELTGGDQRTVRVAAPDLQQAPACSRLDSRAW
jgi:D-tyrosyl-tRNA(Tyr) deacylase